MNSKLKLPLLAVTISTALTPACMEKTIQPNIIFILADDLGWSQTSTYGSNYYKTPNLDRLATEGIKFTNAYAACPVSSPTRASIMTGKYPSRLHITNYIPGPEKRNRLLSEPDWQKFLPLEEITLGEVMRDQGYNTAIFGKWHLSVTKFGPESLPFNPDKQGFNEYFVSDKPNIKDDPEKDAHKSDSIGNTSVKFIKENVSNRFFLFVSFSAIHNPLMEKAGSIDKWQNVKGSEKPENNPVIGAMLATMDNNIGKIINAVDESGLSDNTIIIFFSDNGGLETDAHQTPLKHGKGWLYEGGIRVPLIIKWPGVIKENSISRDVVTSVDFMPTFCDLLNVKNKPFSDGISILSHLKNGKKLPKRNIYWHYPHYHNGPPSGAIRSGKWKLIEFYEKSLLNENNISAYELYDLENDIGESHNLANNYKEITFKLSNELKKWRENVNAQMPVPAIKNK